MVKMSPGGMSTSCQISADGKNVACGGMSTSCQISSDGKNVSCGGMSTSYGKFAQMEYPALRATLAGIIWELFPGSIYMYVVECLTSCQRLCA
jgi:hypothetical protein